MMRPINFIIHFKSKTIFISLLLLIVFFGISTKSAFAQASPSVLYVPLIGLTSVPDPLALPNGAGNVTYHYAVKNFLRELPLTNVQVVDNTCNPTRFVEGDDNGNALLDSTETWRYICSTKLSKTTQSTAIVTAVANNITAMHKAYATVVVGSNTPPPLISIVNITKVAYPLSLPAEGGQITFTYKVNNPGVVPLSDVKVTDDKCSDISGKLGDTNGNNLLDINEVWIYTCTTDLTRTTTNTVKVVAVANGLEAVGDATLTVNVANSLAQASPKFPTTGEKPLEKGNPYAKYFIWAALLVVLGILVVFYFVTRKKS